MIGRTRFRAILFDLDGTLVDTAADLAQAVNAVLALDKLEALSVEAVRGMIGAGIHALTARAYAARGQTLSEAELDERAATTLTVYTRDPARHSRLMPGAKEAIDWCGSEGLPLAVVTNKPIAPSRVILDQLRISDAFATVMAGDLGLPLKPAPDLLLAAVAALKAEPADAVMVGDSAADVQAARAAGIAVICVGGGYTDREPHQLGADRAIATLAQLPGTLAAWHSGASGNALQL